MKSKELSVDLSHKIVTRHRSGQEYETISKALSVLRIIVASKMVKQKNGTNRTLPIVGCPAKLSDQARRALVRKVTKNPMVDLTEVPKSSAEMGEPAVRTTISSAQETLLQGARNLRLRQQLPEICSQDNAGVASGQVSDCPWVAQLKPRLKPHRTTVERPEDGSSQMLPIQSDGA